MTDGTSKHPVPVLRIGNIRHVIFDGRSYLCHDDLTRTVRHVWLPNHEKDPLAGPLDEVVGAFANFVADPAGERTPTAPAVREALQRLIDAARALGPHHDGA